MACNTPKLCSAATGSMKPKRVGAIVTTKRRMRTSSRAMLTRMSLPAPTFKT